MHAHTCLWLLWHRVPIPVRVCVWRVKQGVCWQRDGFRGNKGRDQAGPMGQRAELLTCLGHWGTTAGVSEGGERVALAGSRWPEGDPAFPDGLIVSP